MSTTCVNTNNYMFTSDKNQNRVCVTCQKFRNQGDTLNQDQRMISPQSGGC